MTGSLWIVVFLIAATTDTFGLECPENENPCICQPSHNDAVELQCPAGNNSYFIVSIDAPEYVLVQCRNSPDWSEFRLKETYKLNNKHLEFLRLRWCSLPSNFSLAEITQRLGIETVDNLVYQSFGNLSNTLKRLHFENIAGVKKLILSSNGISALAEDLLANFHELTWLDLRENDIQQLPPGIFNSTPKLEILELGENKISALEPGTFDGLTNLRLLNLWKNHLTEIKSGVFDKMVSLKSLDLHSNNLRVLSADVFAKLENLETLALFGNNFASLPEDLLRRNKKLKVVNLYANKRELATLPDGFFANLTELKAVKLKKNGMLTLPENVFWGATLLTNVSMERNFLTSLPEGLFRDAKEMRLLDLSYNKLGTLPDNIFSNATKLVKLDLSRNLLTSISRHTFNGLQSLEEINLEGNQLATAHESSFSLLKSLRIARLSNNRLTSSVFRYYDTYGPITLFHECTALEELYLANNSIPEIVSDLSHLKLRVLDLKYNDITFVSTDRLQFVSKKIKVDLTYNKIAQIQLSNIELFVSLQTDPRDVIILLDHNPINCDCHLYDLLRYLEGRMHPYVQNYFHIKAENLTCHSPEWLEDIQITLLKSKTLKCVIDDSQIDIKCPKNCTCWARPDDKTFLVDCSYRNLTEAPANLRTLDQQHALNQIELQAHRIELNFTGNMLTKIPSLEHMGLENISTLLLGNNNISTISPDGIPKTLEVLELHDNNLTTMSHDVLDFLRNSSTLTRLTLHMNPWKCDCDAREFLNFLQTKYSVIPDFLEVACEDSGKPISEMTASELCPVRTGMIVGISLAIAVTGLIIGTIAALYYRYQREIKVWLYAHQWCLWLVTEDELDKDKLYDAFISYSHKDEDFVVNEIVRNLENGPQSYKLCLHFRDWLAGEWIPTQIARSVEQSKRTIVILSPNFLESVWGRMEFRAAHSQALSEGRARVILILYGEIGPTDELDPELKAYLSMNTYVKWGDPWFWDKLRYALPHSQDLTRRAKGKKIFEKQHPCIQINGEKKELIYPPGVVPETPPAVTTPPADSLKVFICEGEAKTAPAPNDFEKESKLNGSVKPVFTINQELIKTHSKLSKIQCTTV